MPHDIDVHDRRSQDDPDDLALPRRKVAPIDQWLNRAFRFVAMFVVACVFGLGMWVSLNAVTEHGARGPTMWLGLAVGIASAVGAVLTRRAIRSGRR